MGGAGAAEQRLSIDAGGRTEFGAGLVTAIPEFVAQAGDQRALVVTDAGLLAVGIVDRVTAALTRAGMEHLVHADIGANPSTDEVDRGAEVARSFGRAAVVAVGGGSPLDAAKAISLLAGNPGATAAGIGGEADPAAGWPLIAVPTTSGTGAETNGFGVIEDACARRKVYIGHSSVRPRVAVLDPELTIGLPAHVTAATGIDALVHGVESLASRGANVVSAAYAARAVTVLGHWLPAVHRDGRDLEARAQVMLGAHLAGRALTISGLGLVHGIGHALTAHTGTPHGVALAAVLDRVLEFNAPAAAAAFEETARALRVAPSDVDWTGAALAAVREIGGTLGVARPLRALGATADLLPRIAESAVADPVTGNNPRAVTVADVLAILRSVF
ncbi:methanol dehydrogenase [Amycolatopsis antarctica]|uniref:Methanol dehydrogenase n=1 Tax=Amycolatopsis antarctica TaxID=1854586 RepID=A0A263D8C0_9PSEU|nr:methanol dehydrogenase [Amycolatopsis antarctica]